MPGYKGIGKIIQAQMKKQEQANLSIENELESKGISIRRFF